MYHGNPSAADGQSPAQVWSNAYRAVWHLGGNLEDSTGHGHTATDMGSTIGEGIVGGGRGFDGTTQYIDTTFDADLAEWTVMAWARGAAAPDGTGQNGPLMREQNFQLAWDYDDTSLRGAASMEHPAGWIGASFGALVGGTWYLLAATYGEGTLVAYRDGLETGRHTEAAAVPEACADSAKIGRHSRRPGANEHFAGSVDEVRISRVARTACWIQAEHRSMADALITVGPEEQRPTR